MRVLVTGATGFVGQHLLRLLSSGRNEIFGTFLQHDLPEVSRNVKLLECDLRECEQVLAVVRDVRPNHVYHLAALSSVRDSFNEARGVYEANFFGTLNLLEAIRESQIGARVLLVTSAHAYGRIKSTKMLTEEHPLAPDTPYGVSKAAADMLGSQFFQTYGLKVIRARPFNHTGPGQSPDFVCSDFARQFAAIELGLMPPTVHVGNIDARRDFSDVRDVVRAYALLMRKGRPGDAYNVGSGSAVSLRQILKILSSFCSRKVRIEVAAERVRRGEADVMCGSNRKIRQATGWVRKYELHRTLEDIYTYWQERLQLERMTRAGAFAN